jgi:multicomponent Na+:H+ antiporter subunit D
MIGVPGTVGFVSKWYLVLATLERGLWPIAVIVMITSLMAVVYVWRVVEAAYFEEPDTSIEIKEAPWPMVASAWVLAAACVVFGLATELTIGTAEQAARMMLGAGS